MECAYCHNEMVNYYEEENGIAPLKYCSFTCQAVHRTIEDSDHLSLYHNALTLDAIANNKKGKPAPLRPKTLGPGSELPTSIPLALRKFMLRSTKYVASLSLFAQYLIWRYTAGSASINSYLIFKGKINNPDNAIYWAFLFFLYWKNTASVGSDLFPQPYTSFMKFAAYFRDPDSLLKLSQVDALKVVALLFPLYIESLDDLIRGAPAVKEGFHVYKIAGNYPGLPTSSKDVPKKVPQLPFNSTTINPHFNFGIFSSPEATGNMFDLRIGKGARVLYVPAEFHAYPFEKEIFLPSNSSFNITSSYQGMLDVIDPQSVKMITLQEPARSIVMGPVYEVDTYQPCKSGACKSAKKPFTIFIADYAAK